MNDVVTAARRRPRVLVTGFGPFPGAPTNPTLAVLRLLEACGVDGVDLAFAQLPVTFAGVAPALREAARHRPDAVLLLGLAKSRVVLNVETLARNVAGHVTPDTDGFLPSAPTLVDGAPHVRAATWPAAAILAALHAAGHEAILSDDAGAYVCNAALFHALGDRLAPSVGFLHVPPTRDDGAETGPLAETLAAAVRTVVGVLASTRAPPIPPPAPADELPLPGRRR